MIKYINALKNSKAFKIIENDINNDTLSHAYMLISEDDEALESLRTLIALRLYCENCCTVCRKCTQIINGNCPDILEVTDEKSIGVGKIETALDFAYLTPTEDEFKTIFILNAQRMTLQAQNKFLKTLEEPQDGVVIILTVDNENKLLNTIKSRCKKIKLELFPKEVIVNELVGNYSESQKEEAAESAEGLITRAQELLSESKAEEIIEALIMLKSSKDVLKVSTLDIWNNLNDALDMLEMVFCDIMYIINGMKNSVRNRKKTEKLLKLSEIYSNESIVNIDTEINKCREKLILNCNPITVLEGLLFKILEVNYLCRK